MIMACMDYMDPNVPSPQKVIKLNNSLWDWGPFH